MVQPFHFKMFSFVNVQQVIMLAKEAIFYLKKPFIPTSHPRINNFKDNLTIALTLTISPPLIKGNNGIKVKGEKLGQRL